MDISTQSTKRAGRTKGLQGARDTTNTETGMDHLSKSIRMEEDGSHMTESIINLTLEIIYLLTGESFPPLKSGDHMTITVPPCDSKKLERNKMEKILEVTSKITKLLTGELSSDGKFSMEKSKNFEGHKYLYKDVMMENQPPLTSPDGSSNGNPPERCPRPLYSRDYSTQEGHTIPHHHQSGNLGDFNIIVKEEDEEYDVMEGIHEGHKDIIKNPPNKRNPPKRGPRPLYSTQEDDAIPHHHQGLIIIKVEDKGEETYVRDDQQYTEEGTSTKKSKRHAMEKPSKDRLTLSPGCRMEDEDIVGENKTTSNVDGGLPIGGRPSRSSDPPRTDWNDCGIRGDENFSCPKCGESFYSELSLSIHQRSHSPEKKQYFCPECGKSFAKSSHLSAHQRLHTGEKPYSCSECGKRFSHKSNLTSHHRLHTGEKPFTCNVCWKSYTRKTELAIHQRTHTGQDPFPCPECGKCYVRKSDLITHRRSHTGELPYSCSECGKMYARKSKLAVHQRSHTGVKPYSCTECGKSYSLKSDLLMHQVSHTGEKTN